MDIPSQHVPDSRRVTAPLASVSVWTLTSEHGFAACSRNPSAAGRRAAVWEIRVMIGSQRFFETNESQRVFLFEEWNKMRRILIAFGLMWVFVWCWVGFYLGSQHLPHIEEMEKLAREGNLVEFWSTMNIWKLRASSHSHSLGFASILILVALVMPDMSFSDGTKKALGVLLIVGVALSSIFGWFLFLPLVLIGEILVVAVVLMGFLGVLRGLRETSEAA